jgi:hypothetical protein
MKNETKKVLLFIVLIALYLLQGIGHNIMFGSVYLFGFLAAVILLYVIKNKFIGFLSGLALLLAMEFYDSDYKQLTVLAFLLICIHKDLLTDINYEKSKRKKRSSFSFFCIQITIIFTIALLIYDFIEFPDKYLPDLIFFNRSILIFIWLIGLFIYSIKATHTQDKVLKQANKEVLNNLRFTYFVSIFSFIATVLYFYIRIAPMKLHHTVVFFPWFVYICAMLYNGDVYIKSLANSIESLLEKISNRDMVK